MRPTAALRSADPRGRAAAMAAPATDAARRLRAALATLILPLALASAWPSTADAAPHKAKPHAAAKPAAMPAVKKGKPVAPTRQHKAPSEPVAKKPAHRAEAPRPVTASAMPTPLPARFDPARPRRPAATVKDPGTREDTRTARVACERNGRVYLLEDCARPEPPALRSSQALAEAR